MSEPLVKDSRASLSDLARKMNKAPAQLALNWVATQPGVTSPILGATRDTQLDDNLQSIEFDIPVELRTRLVDLRHFQN